MKLLKMPYKKKIKQILPYNNYRNYNNHNNNNKKYLPKRIINYK